MPKLKVYRTPIGFYDAYVAATSQKAALAAWGADADLFARGAADVVTDERLTEAPLADPGKVIRLPRGTEALHLQALGRAQPAPRWRAASAKQPKPRTKTPAAETQKARVSSEPARRPAAPKRARPRPSRAALDKAEQAVREAEERHEAERRSLAERKRALEQEQRDLRKRQADETDRLTAALKKAGAQFRERLTRWAGAGAE